jgi:LacI family transcriptional regulator/LacI family repressor for deo operon, udp, cdd, tsx, nupC, and nupG
MMSARFPIMACTRVHSARHDLDVRRRTAGADPGQIAATLPFMADRVSIKDIAKAADTTHSTVSRALRDSPLISDATRERVKRLAREMGYTPNAVAQSLQTNRTNAVGLVVTSIADPFLADVVKGVEEVAQPVGLSVFLNASHNDPNQEIQVIETFHRRRVDGILVASSRIGSNHLDRLARIDVPVVLINSEAGEDSDFLHSVTVDDQTGARQAVRHLIDRGHRRIGYLGVRNRPLSNERRRQGYLEALAEAGIEPRDDWVEVAAPAGIGRDQDVTAAEALTPSLLGAGVTAIFCFNDMVATGVLLACKHQDVRVPDACSVVGFDDIDLARYVTPSLTTVHQLKREMGSIAMQMLHDLIEGKAVQNRVLPPRFVRRESTAPPPRSDA